MKPALQASVIGCRLGKTCGAELRRARPDRRSVIRRMRDARAHANPSPFPASWFLSLSVALLLFGCGGSGAGGGEPSTNANLTQLRLSVGSLSPAFDSATTNYSVTTGYLARSLTVTVAAASAAATVTVNNATVLSGAPSPPISLTEGDTVVRIDVTAASGERKSYTITVTRQGVTGLSQSAHLKASNGGAFDWFGRAVAIDGDTLVVGAPQEDSAANGVNNFQEDNSAGNSGAVYVLVHANGEWSQRAYVKASNPETGDLFGSSIALSGDTLVVGAPQEDSTSSGVNGTQNNNDALESGAVYVFIRTNGAWSQQAYLKASNPGISDFFGSSVALFGDTLVVGAPGEDNKTGGINGNQNIDTEPNSGAVYVFTRANGVWSQQAYVKASRPEAFDAFGSSVALSENTLAVGALGEDSNSADNPFNNDALDSGAVYVYARSQTTWTMQAYLKASNPEKEDHFGFSLSLDRDTLAVGAIDEDSNATGVNGDQGNNTVASSGAVYILTRHSNAWTQQAYIKATNPDIADQFGYSVSVADDTLAVGAIGEDSAAMGINPTQGQNDNSATLSGAAYVFIRDNDAWAPQAYVKASNTDQYASFGGAVSLQGDTLAIGAYNETAGGTGAVYVIQ